MLKMIGYLPLTELCIFMYVSIRYLNFIYKRAYMFSGSYYILRTFSEYTSVFLPLRGLRVDCLRIYAIEKGFGYFCTSFEPSSSGSSL
jgi:hypothetical protein